MKKKLKHPTKPPVFYITNIKTRRDVTAYRNDPNPITLQKPYPKLDAGEIIAVEYSQPHHEITIETTGEIDLKMGALVKITEVK